MRRQSTNFLVTSALVFLLVSCWTKTVSQDIADHKQVHDNSGFQILTQLDPADSAKLEKSYLPEMIRQIYKAWLLLIPPEAKPPQREQGTVGIRFHLLADGKVEAKHMVLEHPSGDVALDRAAWGAIHGASPYGAYPSGMKVTDIEMRLSFKYNPDASSPTPSK